jgi:tellurite resistance protein TerC
MESIAPAWLWAFFVLSVLVALFVDFVVLKKQGAHAVGVKEALNWSVIWVLLSFAFNGLFWWAIYQDHGAALANEKSMEFLTGYLIEKSLAVDNIFVFLMIFTYFAVPAEFQKRVLMIGIIGAIVLRTVMILVGAWLIQEFHWVLYVFGAFLVATGIKMWWAAGQEPDLEANPALKLLRRLMPVSRRFDGEKFFTIENGKRIATPLLLVIALVGITDVIFAVDSIPAIFAITTDPFIVLTSNVFAILGLRAMYFLLAAVAAKFHLLSYGLAVILVFIGTKMLLIDIFKIPVAVSLGVVVAILGLTMPANLSTHRQRPAPGRPRKGGFECVQIGGRELEPRRVPVLLQVRGAHRLRNRQHAALPEHPGQRHLHAGGAVAGGDVVEYRVRRQLATIDRRIGHQRHRVQPHPWQQLELGAALAERVIDLVARTGTAARQGMQLTHVGQIEIAHAPVPDAAAALQDLEAVDGVLQRHPAAPVQQVQIDVVELEALQAAFTGGHHAGRIGIFRQHLGDDEELFALHLAGAQALGDGLADDRLGTTVGVHLGRIDDPVADLEGQAQCAQLRGLAGGGFAVAPGSEPERRQLLAVGQTDFSRHHRSDALQSFAPRRPDGRRAARTTPRHPESTELYHCAP